MATALAPPPITVDQYLGFAGYPGLRDELINGKIVLSPQPKPHHQQVVKNLFLLLNRCLEGTPFTVQMNSNLRLDDCHSMPAPDLFAVRKIAWRQAIEENRYLSEPPLLVAEVISPANRLKHVHEKTELYVRHGVPHVLVIYPKKQTAALAVSSSAGPHLEPIECFHITSPVAIDLSAADLFVVG